MINFDRLIEERDIPGLVAVLRNPADPDLRLAAARALGELGEVDAVEPLILSYLKDPDPAVRSASRDAVRQLAGADADLAISTYASGPMDDEAWLVDLNLDLREKEWVGGDEDEEDEPSSIDLQGFIARKDLKNLVACLRYPDDPQLRLEAARALGELGKLEAVEPLILSHLKDPDPDVRKTARDALQLLTSSNADLAITSYAPGSPLDQAEWLMDLGLDVEEEEEEDDEVEQEGDEPGPYTSDLKAFIEVEDLDGLVACLRHPADAELRAAAADALGELGDRQGVKFLLRAYQEDPESGVREKAYKAIYTILGPNTDQAISDFKSTTQPLDPWLVRPASDLIELVGRPGTSASAANRLSSAAGQTSPGQKEHLAQDDGASAVAKLAALPPETEATVNEVRGLVAVLSGERDISMRLKAIQALKRIHDIHAVEVLASSVLYSDEAAIRTAARKALEDLFGEDTPSIVESYRSTNVEDQEDEEAEEEEGEEEPEEEMVPEAPVSSPSRPDSLAYPTVRTPKMDPVIQEDGFPWRMVLLIGAGLVIVLVLILLFVH